MSLINILSLIAVGLSLFRHVIGEQSTPLNSPYGIAPSDFIPGVFPPPGPAPAFGDPSLNMDTAFVFATDTAARCTTEQQQKIRDSFRETMELATHLYEFADAEIRGEIISPHMRAGEMLEQLFDITPNNFLQGQPQKADHTEILHHIRGLAVFIANHAFGRIPFNSPAPLVNRQVRIYCDDKWLVKEIYQRDSQWQLTNIPHENPLGMWIDMQTHLGINVRNDDTDPGMSCDGGEAFFEPQMNVLSFCPTALGYSTLLERPSTPFSNGGFHIDRTDGLSSVFFHEYTHIIGRAAIPGAGVVDVELNDGSSDASGDFDMYDGDSDTSMGGTGQQEELAYGFSNCRRLAEQHRGEDGWNLAHNADSYMLLAVACTLDQFYWGNGFASW